MPWTGVVIAAPSFVAAVAVAVVSISSAAGVGPFRAVPSQSPSDAAIRADVAGLVFRARLGEDLNAPYDMSPDLVPGRGSRPLRPLEAAVLSGDALTIEIARREGASLPLEELQRVVCAVQDADIARMLAGDEVDPTRCAHGGEAGF